MKAAGSPRQAGDIFWIKAERGGGWGGGVSASSLIVWTFYLADKIPAAAVAAAAAQADKFAVLYAAFAHNFVFCFF